MTTAQPRIELTAARTAACAWFRRAVGIALLATALCNCGGLGPVLTPTTNAVGDKIEAAIASLDKNSADWQATLKTLSDDVRSLETQTANDIDLIAQRGIAAAGAEFRCDADFLGNRVKEELHALLAKVRGKAPPPRQPAICHVVFSPAKEVKATKAVLDMVTRPKELLYYGYNLGGVPGITAILKHDAGEVSLQPWLNWPSPYLMTLTTAEGAAPLCNLTGRRILVRHGSDEKSSIGVIPLECPKAPPAPPQTVSTLINKTDTAYGNYVGGFGQDRDYGGACSPGFRRRSFQVIHTASQGAANCDDGKWSDPSNSNDCRVRVHYSIGPSFPNPSANYATCQLKILEESIPQPPPPPPPCPCW
jgi:hypothetical protein